MNDARIRRILVVKKPDRKKRGPFEEDERGCNND
jgi:hypothetical protein